MLRSTRTVALAAALLACAPKASIFSDADANAIRQLATDFTTRTLAADWDAWTDLFTEDVAFLPPNGTIVSGKGAVRAFGEASPKLTTFTTEVIDVAGSGDVGYARGTYVLTATSAGAPPVEDRGKWLDIYRKQADGSWRLSYNVWNSDLPLPTATAAPTKR